MQHQRISPRSRQLWTFRIKASFYGEELLAPRPTPKLEDNPLSVVRDCLFSIFGATVHIGRSIRKLRTRHAVATGTRYHCVCVCVCVYTHTHTHVHTYVHTHNPPHFTPLCFTPLFFNALYQFTPPRNLLFLIFGTPFGWLRCRTPAAYFWWNNIVAYNFLFTPCWISFHKCNWGVKQGLLLKKKRS